MKTFLLAGAVCLPAAIAPEALAQVYVGGGYTQLQMQSSSPSGSEDFEFGAFTARAGYQLNPFFALEGEASFGVDGDEANRLGLPPSAPGSTTPVELDSVIGAFAVGRLPLPAVADLFARVGVANVSLDVGPGITTIGEAEDKGLAYGAGIEVSLFLMLKARAEYTVYDAGHGYDGFSLSALLKF